MSRRFRSGQALIEVALTLPIILILVFGMIQVGNLYTRRETVADVANMVAEQAAITPRSGPATWPASVTSTANFLLQPFFPTVTTTIAVDPSPASLADSCRGRHIHVTVTGYWTLAIPLLPSANLPVSASADTVCLVD